MCGCYGLSSDRVLKILTQIGFPQTDAKVYLFLAIKGPKKAEDLTDSLQMLPLELNIILRRLQERRLVAAAPATFVALPFEKMMEMLAKERLEEAQDLAEKKRVILSQWRSLVYGNTRS
jgi:sugar-specific transcriptional regulator TrmB